MRYEDKSFQSETVPLDGNEFHRCRFLGVCNLVYGGGTIPVLQHNSFENVPKVAFIGSAGDTLAFLKLLFHGGFQVIVDDTFQNIRGGISNPPNF